jgi:hypothetical protein
MTEGNPWLAIPAADYEGHMAEAGVDQVLQLPGGEAQISETGISSLRLLSGLMRLVPPARLSDLAAREGLTLRSSTPLPLARGKAFWVATFACEAGPPK